MASTTTTTTTTMTNRGYVQLHVRDGRETGLARSSLVGGGDKGNRSK